MKSQDDNRVLVFMYTNVIANTYIIHTLFIEDQMVEAQYDPKDYEGVGILTVITLYYDYFIYETIGRLNINQEYLYKPNSVDFLIGGTGIIYKKYELAIFRGWLSRRFIQNYYRYPQELIKNSLNLNSLGGYSVFCWAKYYQNDAYSITILEDYKDEVNLGDEIVKITVCVDLSDLNNCGYDVISHHYKMPCLMYLEDEAMNQKIILRNDLPYLEILRKWHFISFEYGLEQNKINNQRAFLRIKTQLPTLIQGETENRIAFYQQKVLCYIWRRLYYL